ncbi:glycosyltransferase family 4 protein [Candidatus Woesebacteria bacterium]|nr:glycosyltransferase family 4 protein [Candidatus Woesebacteria bacterium]MCD8526871.1 glycosyltransferase family 4 protein [Candidatus Woesebacteria bacterium]MCD8545791.1 glycosyltransferase family 4 protein [Candidatus Woesebacteria bacterium]
MKIAMISSPFVPVPPKKYGGTERVIYYLIKGLLEKGHEVTLFATGDSEVECELVPICEKHLFFGKTKAEQEQIVEKLQDIEAYTNKLLRERAHEFDIIHSHGFDLIEFQHLPNVTTLHGMFTLEEMEYYEQRQCLHYVSISNNQQKPYPDLEYVGTAYNGLDPAEFPVVTEPEKYACFLGRLDREKNPDKAIELAISLGMPIKVAGKVDHLGSEYFDEVLQPLMENPLVEFLGEIGMAEKTKLLSNAAVNLHPTNFREPFGLTVLEAAYCGTPTIAVKRGSMSEIIENHRTGILVEDFTEAYHLMEECLELDREYVAQRARLLFNYHTMTESYLKAYEQVTTEFAARNQE